MHDKRVYEIDGAEFSTLEEFYNAISQNLIPGAEWGRNLDAFDDILSGGFGTPDEGFVLRWKNSQVSRERLGYPETIRQLEKRLGSCHPSNRTNVANDLSQARRRCGSTVFEWLVRIIEVHCPGGREEEDGVELCLE